MRSFVSLTVGLVAACLIASGCSSSGSPHSAGGSAGGSGAVAAAGGGGTGGGKATCKQLTFAEVQPLLIEKIVSVDVTVALADGTGQQCVFDGHATDRSGAVDVLVLSGKDATQAYTEAVSGESDGPESVAGVGDKATRDKGDPQISALKGDVFCSVSLSDGDDVPGVGPLEDAANHTTDINDSYWNTVAVALGTLCNRIYGSGNTTPDLSSLIAADTSASAGSAGSGAPSGGGLPTDVTLPTDGALPTDSGLPTDATLPTDGALPSDSTS